MKKITLTTIFIALGSLLTISMTAQNKMKPTEEAVKNLKPYAEMMDSLERHVIYVEQKTDEDLFKIELIAGKTMEVDCNRHRLMGQFEEGTVQGWGYTYHTFQSDGKVVSTMMACPQPKEMKFVTGPSTMIRYNSRLPIVVYLAKGMELRYRIWSASEEFTAE